jgi:NTP pyrophosphatase (non-canonical NTP hydrolase)
MMFEELEAKVVEWSKARQIIPNSTPQAQFLKAVSEIGELADAVNKRDLPATKDAVGDSLVCLINMCALLDITMTECLELAYNEIKDRKGTLLPSGIFVKEPA